MSAVIAAGLGQLPQTFNLHVQEFEVRREPPPLRARSHTHFALITLCHIHSFLALCVSHARSHPSEWNAKEWARIKPIPGPRGKCALPVYTRLDPTSLQRSLSLSLSLFPLISTTLSSLSFRQLSLPFTLDNTTALPIQVAAVPGTVSPDQSKEVRKRAVRAPLTRTLPTIEQPHLLNPCCLQAQMTALWIVVAALCLIAFAALVFLVLYAIGMCRSVSAAPLLSFFRIR